MQDEWKRYVFVSNDGTELSGDSAKDMADEYAARYIGWNHDCRTDSVEALSEALGLDFVFCRPEYVFDHLENINAGRWKIRDFAIGRHCARQPDGSPVIVGYAASTRSERSVLSSAKPAFDCRRHLLDNLSRRFMNYSERAGRLIARYNAEIDRVRSTLPKRYLKSRLARSEAPFDATLVCRSRCHDLSVMYRVRVGANTFDAVRHSRGCDCGFPVNETDYEFDIDGLKVGESYFMSNGNRVMIYVSAE